MRWFAVGLGCGVEGPGLRFRVAVFVFVVGVAAAVVGVVAGVVGDAAGVAAGVAADVVVAGVADAVEAAVPFARFAVFPGQSRPQPPLPLEDGPPLTRPTKSPAAAGYQHRFRWRVHLLYLRPSPQPPPHRRRHHPERNHPVRVTRSHQKQSHLATPQATHSHPHEPHLVELLRSLHDRARPSRPSTTPSDHCHQLPAHTADLRPRPCWQRHQDRRPPPLTHGHRTRIHYPRYLLRLPGNSPAINFRFALTNQRRRHCRHPLSRLHRNRPLPPPPLSRRVWQTLGPSG